jgi:hypothetical protein
MLKPSRKLVKYRLWNSLKIPTYSQSPGKSAFSQVARESGKTADI